MSNLSTNRTEESQAKILTNQKIPPVNNLIMMNMLMKCRGLLKMVISPKDRTRSFCNYKTNKPYSLTELMIKEQELSARARVRWILTLMEESCQSI